MSLRHPWEVSSEAHLREWPELQTRQASPSILADMLSAFFRKKQLICIGLLLFVGGLTAFLLVSPATYESRMVYLVRDEGAAFPITTFESPSGSQQNTSQLATDVQIGTEVELLSETDLHRDVLYNLHPGATPKEIEKQLNSFEHHLKVFPVPKTTLIAVTYVGTSQEGANATLQALEKVYQQSRVRLRGTDKAYAFFAAQANRYQDQLRADQKNLADFEQDNHVALLDQEKNLVTQRLSEARTLLDNDDATAAEASQKLESMKSERELLPARLQTQTRTLPDQMSTEHFRSLLIDLQNKRLELLNKYQGSDRRLLELDQQIANTRSGLEAAQTARATEEQSDVNPVRVAVDTDLEHVKFQLAGLRGRRKSLQTQIDAYDVRLQHLNRITEQHDGLERSVKQDTDNLSLYAKRREEAKIGKTLDGNDIANISIVSGPTIVPQPLGQKVLGIASVYVIGCVIILSLGIVSGHWTPTFQAPWEIETVVGSPVLATVPSHLVLEGQRADPGKIENAISRRTQPRVSETEGRTTTAQIASLSKIPLGLYGTYFPLVEKLRKICPTRPGALVFAFTASNPGEGVSHVTRGLAEELQSITGKRIAMVGAPDDNRTSSLYLNAVAGEGVGPHKESGEEFLRSWFRKLREANDYVLVDCPSMRTSHAAIAIGRESDGMLLVVGAGDATRSQVSGSLLALSLASVPLVGIALNKRTYPIPAYIYRRL